MARRSAARHLDRDQVGANAFGPNAVGDASPSGGTEIAVSQAGVQSSSVFGRLVVSTAGFAQLDTMENRGRMTVLSGGAANLTTVGNGGTEIVHGGADSQTQVASTEAPASRRH